MKFHIFKYSSDKKSLCGQTNKDYGLFIDASGYSPADFFKKVWRGYEFKSKCLHCENNIMGKNFTYK